MIAVLAIVGLLFALAAGGAGAAVASSRRRIIGRDRAAGVTGELQQFLSAWEESGPFDLLVGQDGGLRTDAAKQLEYYESGASKAKTLGETPHGRGGAIDVYPVIDGIARGLSKHDQGPEVRALFAQIGAFGKARGLVWGGDFKSIYDGPHLEVANWRSLPMPPARVA